MKSLIFELKEELEKQLPNVEFISIEKTREKNVKRSIQKTSPNGEPYHVPNMILIAEDKNIALFVVSRAGLEMQISPVVIDEFNCIKCSNVEDCIEKVKLALG